MYAINVLVQLPFVSSTYACAYIVRLSLVPSVRLLMFICLIVRRSQDFYSIEYKFGTTTGTF